MVDLIDTVAFNVDTTSFQVLNNAGTGIQMTAGNTAAWAGSATWNALTWNAQTAVTAGDDYLDYNVNVANRVTIGNLGGVPNVQLNVPVSGVPATEPYRTAFRFKATLN